MSLSVIGEVTETGRKRARREEAPPCSSTRSCSLEVSNENDRALSRAKKLSSKIHSLYNEFPEMKFLIDFENLKLNVEAAVEKYAEEVEESKNSITLPDELVRKCLAFLGKGHYGSIALTSKKLWKTYKEEFGRETGYLEMATSVDLASHCFNELCTTLKEKDEIIKAAAVNGNVDFLRYAVSNGHDLFQLVKMNYKRNYGVEGLHYALENEKKYSSKLIERGHLHVLKYLHEELNHFLGLQRYCEPAIQHGQLEILEWLLSIGCLGDDDLDFDFVDFCRYAIKSGKLKVLKWLLQRGFRIVGCGYKIIADAVRSESLEMIQYCFDEGFNRVQNTLVQEALKEIKNVKVFRLMYDLGYDYRGIDGWYHTASAEYFEIIKFLRSISIPWDDDILREIVEHGTLEMLQYAYEEGCSWTTHGEEYSVLFGSDEFSFAKLEFLMETGCKFDHDNPLNYSLLERRELALLDYFIGIDSIFDNELLKKMFNHNGSEPWFVGISYLLEKGKHLEKFRSIEEVFQRRHSIDGIKYFHSQGLPWCLDPSRNTQLLSKIACFNDLDGVKWAYENGCKGGNSIPYVEVECGSSGMRCLCNPNWRVNKIFFERNGMLHNPSLSETESRMEIFVNAEEIDAKNAQEIGASHLKSLYSWFHIDFAILKILIDHGYTFRSISEQKSVTKEAYRYCCEHSQNEDYRKRFALFVGMGVRGL
ncbi:hypothetical protein CTEN210_12016 [Chaetoceros tenuissimus]|uniref:Uncharacterized protein n=1 Tax=Chaetoceros tenuissimus TaxID=426638 RepID=A0AAD3D2V3_9STRA|nr:hypothetical protein CTEN210_12016 [Chaetoceros tenuissimus]